MFDDLEKYPAPDYVKDAWRQGSVKSSWMFPIMYKNNPLAVIFLTNTQPAKPVRIKNREFLETILQRAASGINLYFINDKLDEAIKQEKNIREIVLRIRQTENHNQIFDYMLKTLIELYGADRALHLHYYENGDLYVNNEINNTDNPSMMKETLFNVKDVEKFFPACRERICVANNVNVEIKDAALKKYLLKNQIQAFILYPISCIMTEKTGKPLSTAMVCCSCPKKWLSTDIESLKLVIETTSLAYFDIIRKRELDEIKRTFLATLTHDLRSPLIAEQKALELILSGKIGTSLDDYSEYLQDMHKTNEELLRIVSNILMTYHYESERVELNLQQNYISEVINEAVTIAPYGVADPSHSLAGPG
jgi:hypothetical protein